MSNRGMKASGVEWIGEIPEIWEVNNTKFVFQSITEKNNPIKSNEVLSLLKDVGVIRYSDKGDIGNKCSEDITRYHVVRKNDIVMNSMNVIIGSVGKSDYDGVLSPVYHVLRIRNQGQNDVDYFDFLFKTREFQRSLRGYGNGILEHRMRIPISNLNKVKLPLPPLHEQQAIATYLDDQVSLLDRLIKDQQQVIEEWKAYKQSLITETVTKGLDPEVEMKDSGIEWIGEIPNHWELRKIKQLFKQSYVKGGEHLVQLSATQKYGVIPQSYLDSVVKISEKVDLNTFKRVEINDFIISLRSFQGGFEMAHHNGVITPAYTVFKNKEEIYHNYFKHLFKSKSFIAKINSITIGIREGKDVKWNDSSILLIPSPPLHEQQQIADFLDEKCLKIDQLIEDKQRLIEDLKAYKQSLIYECVTGKKEIV